MLKHTISIVSVSLFLSISAIGAEYQTINGTITRIVDGNKFEFTLKNQKYLGKLAGTLSPTIRSNSNDDLGIQAKVVLGNYLLNRRVRLDFFGYDSEGYAILIVWMESRCVNYDLIIAGRLQVNSDFTEEPYRTWFISAEKEARQNAQGIWK